jgi:antitoxin PrlF
MHEVVIKLTQRSQVTVPAEVRRILGLSPRGQVAFEIDGDQVRLKSVKWTLDSVAGSVKPLHDGPQDFDKMVREAKEEAAGREIEKLNRR